MALATRKFGTTCPICKRFCFLSYIEIDEYASVGELRTRLLEQGWLGEPARCDDPKCDGETYCAWNQAIFPREPLRIRVRARKPTQQRPLRWRLRGMARPLATLAVV